MKNQLSWLAVVAVAVGGFTISSTFASVPSKGRITDDTAIYQNLSEVRVARQGELSFDNDINHLTSLQARYRENLPSLHERVSGPMKRVSAQKYKRKAVGSSTAQGQ